MTDHRFRRFRRFRAECFVVADGRSLPVRTAECDVALSGLGLNFLPTPSAAVAEAARIERPGERTHPRPRPGAGSETSV